MPLRSIIHLPVKTCLTFFDKCSSVDYSFALMTRSEGVGIKHSVDMYDTILSLKMQSEI